MAEVIEAGATTQESTQTATPEIDYKAEYEKALKAQEDLKAAQSGSDRKVQELSLKIRELELATLSEKEREAKIREQEKLELEQLRVEKKQMENKAFALEQLSKAKLPAELVESINLSIDRDKILESVIALEKAAQAIKDQAIEDYKKEHRPGFKSSTAFDPTKKLTVDELMALRNSDPDAFNALPEHLKKPERQQPINTLMR